MQPVLSAGNHATGAKRGKAPVIQASTFGIGTSSTIVLYSLAENGMIHRMMKHQVLASLANAKTE